MLVMLGEYDRWALVLGCGAKAGDGGEPWLVDGADVGGGGGGGKTLSEAMEGGGLVTLADGDDAESW